MTSRVTVSAHCRDELEVEVLEVNGSGTAQLTKLQNGESKDFYVYDDREITVKEAPKA